MRHIDRADLEILREVGRSDSGLQIFTLHRRLSLGPAQLAVLVRSLASRGLVLLSEDQSRIQLTEEGFVLLSSQRRRAAVSEVQACPTDWIYRSKLKINYPYLPRRSKM